MYFSGIFSEGLEQITKNLSYCDRIGGRDFKPGRSALLTCLLYVLPRISAVKRANVERGQVGNKCVYLYGRQLQITLHVARHLTPFRAKCFRCPVNEIILLTGT